MKNSELIKILQGLGPEKEVSIFWDGGARGDVEGIVDDYGEIVLVGDWSIYRDGKYRQYDESDIVFG